MFKILLYAFNWQYLFDKSFPGNDFGSFDCSALIAVWGVNLTNPAEAVPIRI
jgi:hypothetical protein